jgi:4-hydroxy-2-oxoglutarate aldolase
MNNRPHIYGIIPPLITPFTERGNVDFDAFVRNCERWNREPIGGSLILGSNSETPYLNEEEKLTLIRLAVGTTASERVIIAGTGLESTSETIRLTNKAASIGAHAALVLTPCYYGEQMTESVMIRHFTTVADAADIPVLIYNVPRFTHYNIPAHVVGVLSRHPSIIGMKDSAGNLDQLKAFLSVVQPGFSVIPGSTAVLPAAAGIGVESAILAIANALPQVCHEIIRDATIDPDRIGKLHAVLMSVSTIASDRYGIPGLKYTCTLAGYEGGFPRRPLLPLDTQAQAEIRACLAKSGLCPVPNQPTRQEP